MLNNGQAELNNAFKVINLEAETLKNVLELIQNQLRLIPHTNPMEKEMLKQFKQGNITLVGVDTQYDGNKLQAELQKNGVPHSMYVSISSPEGKGRLHFIAVHNSEIVAAKHIIEKFQNERTAGGITDPSIFGRYADQSARVIENVDDASALLFNRYCEQVHVPIFMQGPDENETWKIVYAEKDSARMNRIRDSVAIDMSGEYGKLVQKELEWENNYRVNSRNAIINGKDENGRELEAGTALVDREGREIEIKRTAIIIRDGDKESKIPRSRESEIEKEVKSLFRCMKDPVLLSASDFQQYKKTPERERPDFLIDIERRSGRLVLSSAEMEVVASAEAERTIIQQKLNQSFYASSSELQNPYNIDQSFWGFKEAELENYQDIHDRSESRFADGEFFNEANAIDNGLMEEIMDRRENLDDYPIEIPLSAIITQSQVLGGLDMDAQNMTDIDFDTPNRDFEDMTLEDD